jgi:hypothetical protein
MNRLGMWSALAYFLLGAAYAAVVATGMAANGLAKPMVDPILAIMELLTLLGAPLLVIIMAAVHASATPNKKAYSGAALAFMTLVVGLTCAVHFVGLTALRQVGAAGIRWPSTLYALELLAWDVFLGISLVCAAPVFQGNGLRHAIRTCLLVTGSLCLLGTLGPATGQMGLQFIAVAGYGVVLPLTALLVAIDFRGAHRSDRRQTYEEDQ